MRPTKTLKKMERRKKNSSLIALMRMKKVMMSWTLTSTKRCFRRKAPRNIVFLYFSLTLNALKREE
jgi:hypothetical protein